MTYTLERIEQIISGESPKLVAHLFMDMANHIQTLKARMEMLEKEQANKDQAAFALEERVKLLRRSLFGASSEKRAEASDRPRSQEEALVFSQSAFPAPDQPATASGEAKGRDLPGQVIEHEMTPEQLQAEASDRGLVGQWQTTGLYDESAKIHIIERSYIRQIHRRMKYKFQPANPEEMEKELIVTAPGVPELLPGMNYTTETVASVVADKYISHVPLERQIKEMESLGLKDMKNATLSRMCALAAAALEPLQEVILKEDLLPTDLALHLDETPWKIQNKHEQDGYMWVISNRSGSYYFFAPTRSAAVMQAKLQGYTGPVVTDGYGSYDTHLDGEKTPRAYCWAHARREFLVLEDHDPSVKPILDEIDELFAVEREARDFTQLAELREQKSVSIIKRLKNLLYDALPRSRPSSQKRKAIEYTLKRWAGLTLFLKDTRVPLSNNEAERTIRHAVMGRKNYYGSGSHSGAATAATLFTIIESCKKNELDPRSFLLMSLQRSAAGEPLETPLAYARNIRQPAK